MTLSLLSRFGRATFTFFIAILISACSTDEFANSVADNIATDATSVSNETISTPITEPTPEPAPEPAPAPAQTPPSEPSSGPIVAMYSYNANLSNAQTLSNASLEQTTVYMFFTNVSQYDSMTFNCCKGKSGDATGEAHSAPVQDTSAPFVYSVDLSQYSTSGTRVLKATASNASSSDDLFVNFSINITSTQTPTEPDPVPTPEPVPEPTPGPTSSADITFTWVAPSQREDDTAISLSEINGYTIHYGTSPGNYNNKISINDGSVVSHTITNLSAGTYYFSITTRDTDGNHSAYSPEASISI